MSSSLSFSFESLIGICPNSKRRINPCFNKTVLVWKVIFFLLFINVKVSKDIRTIEIIKGGFEPHSIFFKGITIVLVF